MLIDLKHETLVANARKLRAISANNRKSDEADAEILARIGRVDTKLLCPIQHGTEEHQRDLLQVKLRDTLVRQRVLLISTVRGLLKSLGIQSKSPSSACFTKKLIESLIEHHSDALKLVDPMLDIIDSLSEKIKELDKKLNELADKKYPETQQINRDSLV